MMGTLTRWTRWVFVAVGSVVVGSGGVGAPEGGGPGGGSVGVVGELVVAVGFPAVGGAGQAGHVRGGGGPAVTGPGQGEGLVVVEVAVDGLPVGAGEPAVAVAGDQEPAQPLTGSVASGAQVEQLPVDRVVGPALPVRVGGELPSHPRGQVAVADQLGGVLPQPQQ